MTKALRDAGFNVTSFDDGAISSDSDLLGHADLVITDIEMPSIDGHQVLQNIREIAPDLPTIVISGASDENVAGIEAALILRKPFEPDELVKAVKRILADADVTER